MPIADFAIVCEYRRACDDIRSTVNTERVFFFVSSDCFYVKRV